MQTVAEKQWQSHRADAELRSVHAIAYAEFADKIDTEHPEVHMALTTGLVAVEKSKELELLSRYSSRIQRDLRNALKELRSLQAERKQREQREMHDAAQIAQLCKMKNQSFKPVDFGFVLRREQVETHLLREKYLAEAAIASKFGFNLRKYLAAVAGA